MWAKILNNYMIAFVEIGWLEQFKNAAAMHLSQTYIMQQYTMYAAILVNQIYMCKLSDRD